MEEPDLGEPTTYAGRKEAAQRRISALLGEKVTIRRGRTEALEWIVVKESKPDNSRRTKRKCRISKLRSTDERCSIGNFPCSTVSSFNI